MRKGIPIISLLLIMAFLLTGCAAGNSTGTGSDTENVTTDQSGKNEESDMNQENNQNNDFTVETVTVHPGDLTFPSGAWSWEGEAVTGKNASGGNCFAMTNVYTPAGESFSLEADLKIVSGRCGGLVFGVLSDIKPDSAWYCVNIDRNKKNIRLFSSGVGDQGTSQNAQRTLSDEELAMDTYRLKVGYQDKRITFWLNGEVVDSREESNFQGGYLGLNTFKGEVRFTNIRYTVGNFRIPLTELKLTVGDRVYPLETARYHIVKNIGEVNGAVSLTVGLPDGFSSEFEGVQNAGSATYSFVPAYGRKNYALKISHPEYGTMSIRLELTVDIPPELIYTDPYRPQYHYSPQKNFTGDPNGLAYNATTGEYHLFHQYNPSDIINGNQVWGHAVSKDLIHWVDLGIAIDREPDGGRIYSGSAVIDYANTTGFFHDGIPAASRMVAIYTVKNPDNSCDQNIAYSLDDGYTWIKYEGNPVIPTSASRTGPTFRDPKVLWIEDPAQENGGLWLMILGGTAAQIFTSHDLKTWEYNSSLKDKSGSPIQSECPDLLHLALDGDTARMKYVYFGAGRFYYVGSLQKNTDGKYEYVVEQEMRTTAFNTGRNYATQSFFNDAKGRCLIINRLRDNTAALLDGKYWNGVQSMPFDTTLVTAADGSMKLCFAPIEELTSLYDGVLKEFANKTLTAGQSVLDDVKSKEYLLETALCVQPNTTFSFYLRGNGSNSAILTGKVGADGKVQITISTTGASTIKGGYTWKFEVEPDSEGMIYLTISVDNTMLDIYINNGEYAISDLIFPDPSVEDMRFLVSSGSLEIRSLVCHQMKSIW